MNAKTPSRPSPVSLFPRPQTRDPRPYATPQTRDPRLCAKPETPPLPPPPEKQALISENPSANVMNEIKPNPSAFISLHDIPYPSPLLWKTGRKNYKYLNLNNLYANKSRRRAQKQAENSQKSAVFLQFSTVFCPKQPIFTHSLFHRFPALQTPDPIPQTLDPALSRAGMSLVIHLRQLRRRQLRVALRRR